VLAWIAVFVMGGAGLCLYVGYLVRGPRRPPLTAEQLAEIQVLAEIERDADVDLT